MISEEYKIKHQSGYSPPKYKCGNHLILWFFLFYIFIICKDYYLIPLKD